ncbi:MAG: MMPL family transporter [Clostridia bacterium]|nr:MMPL family transporter [Clostridia bacterium]
MKKIIELIDKYHKRILWLIGILFVSSVFLFSQLKVASSFEEVMPEDSSILKAMKAYEVYFPDDEMGVLILQGETDAIRSQLPEIKNALEEKEHVKEVLYHIDFDTLGDQRILYGEVGKEGLYFSNEEKDLFLMMVRPDIESETFVSDRAAYYKEVHEVISLYPVITGLTGGAFIQDYEADTVAFNHMGYKVLVTLCIVVAFVIFMFRSFKLPTLALIPLIGGVVITGGFAYLFYGELNMFSVTFTMLLIGLGIDFSVHFLMAIQSKNISSKEDILETVSYTGQSILMGAVTTSVAFLAFIIARFKAFEQMGVISGVGIMILAITTIIILPSILIVSKYKNTPSTTQRDSFNFSGIKKYRYWIWGIFLAFGILLFPYVMNTEVVGDMNKIYPENMPSRAYQALLSEQMDYDLDTLSVLLKKEDSLDVIQEIMNIGSVKSINSIYDFIPPNQSESIEKLKENQIEISRIEIEDLPVVLKEKYINEDMMRIEVIPDFNIYNEQAYENLSKQIEKIAGFQPIGMAALMNEVVALTKSDIIKISVMCLIFILVTLIIIYRSLRETIITILPVLMTLYVTIGILPILNRDINIFSIASFPLILGIGIDNGIHLMHALKHKKNGQLTSTIKAIIITTVTTMIGFGSLGLINHPGMANLGFTLAIGMLLNFLFTLTLIPSIIEGE